MEPLKYNLREDLIRTVSNTFMWKKFHLTASGLYIFHRALNLENCFRRPTRLAITTAAKIACKGTKNTVNNEC